MSVFDSLIRLINISHQVVLTGNEKYSSTLPKESVCGIKESGANVPALIDCSGLVELGADGGVLVQVTRTSTTQDSICNAQVALEMQTMPFCSFLQLTLGRPQTIGGGNQSEM